jgi:hypothetical protein
MPWATLGESVTGTSHQGRNTPCQDAFRFRSFGPSDDWIVLAVADGAGSASRSDVGAILACDEFVRRVGDSGVELLFNREGMTSLFSEVRSAINAEAARLEVPARELACTALLAILGPEMAAFAQVGDGAIVLAVGEEYCTVFWPEPAEYANATDFLTDDRLPDTLQFETMSRPVSEIAVLTDGLQRLALDYSNRSPYTPFFRPLFLSFRTATDTSSLTDQFRAFLDSPRVNARTDDDKTLVLAIRCQ